MIVNNNDFKGPTVHIQIINNYNFAAPETVPKNDALILIDKVMPYVITFIKWAIKFITSIMLLHSG